MSLDSFRAKVLVEIRAAATSGLLPGLDAARVKDTDQSVASPSGFYARAIIVRDGPIGPHPRPVFPMPAAGFQGVVGVIVEWHEPLTGLPTWLADYRAFKTALWKLLWTPNRFLESYAPMSPEWKFPADPPEDLSVAQEPGYHRTIVTGSRRERDLAGVS